MSAWQPIETAPKDRAILLTDGVRQVVGTFMTSVTDGDTAWVYARENRWDGLSFAIPEPTHWMDLPAPPVAA